jgi:hypothetical protein
MQRQCYEVNVKSIHTELLAEMFDKATKAIAGKLKRLSKYEQ